MTVEGGDPDTDPCRPQRNLPCMCRMQAGIAALSATPAAPAHALSRGRSGRRRQIAGWCRRAASPPSCGEQPRGAYSPPATQCQAGAHHAARPAPAPSCMHARKGPGRRRAGRGATSMARRQAGTATSTDSPDDTSSATYARPMARSAAQTSACCCDSCAARGRRGRQAAGQPGRDSAAARSRAHMLAGVPAVPACASVCGRSAWATAARRKVQCAGRRRSCGMQCMLRRNASGFRRPHSQGRTCWWLPGPPMSLPGRTGVEGNARRVGPGGCRSPSCPGLLVLG